MIISNAIHKFDRKTEGSIRILYFNIRKTRLIFNTIRYLKHIQIWGRFIRLFRARFLKSLIINKVVSSQPRLVPPKLSLSSKPAAQSVTQHNIAADRFCFLNHEHRFESGIEWNPPELEKLWVYNLHYFEYLLPFTHDRSPENFETAKRLILDWIEKNPTGEGNGWEPYPLSLRIVNWIFFFDGFYGEFETDAEFRQRFLKSLYQQSFYLTYVFEYHLLANHFFENIKSLFLAGLFFQNKKLLKKGWPLLRQEIHEQILPDGGHFERSPMYHSLILLGVLDILNILKASRRSAPQFFEVFQSSIKMNVELSKLEITAEKMIHWLEAMIHPDGEIALFGDSALNVAPKIEDMRQHYEQISGRRIPPSLAVGEKALSESGYFIFRSRRHYLVIDGGELGVRYQPGHAHCDLLSYEYSFEGIRFIVDSGIGNYQETELRRKARSVYAHNTVVVNGREQAEIWKVFRMGRWVMPSSSSFVENGNVITFSGGYENSIWGEDSYQHQRRVSLINLRFFVFEDSIEGRSIRSIESLIHFHPDCKFEINDGVLELSRNNRRILILWHPRSISTELREWFYAPEFGTALNSHKLVIKPTIANTVKICYVIAPSEYVQEAREYLYDMG